MQAAAVKPFLLYTTNRKGNTKRVKHTQMIITGATHVHNLEAVGWDGGIKKYSDSKLTNWN